MRDDAATPMGVGSNAVLGPLNANEDDPARLWAEVHRLRVALRGPDGYATWQEAAIAERMRRVQAENDVKRLSVGHDRYETARRMGPRQWTDAWRLNLSTGKAFDEIIDGLRPFLRPNAELSGPQRPA